MELYFVLHGFKLAHYEASNYSVPTAGAHVRFAGQPEEYKVDYVEHRYFFSANIVVVTVHLLCYNSNSLEKLDELRRQPLNENHES